MAVKSRFELMTAKTLILGVILLSLGMTVMAGANPGEEVVVVYNSRVPVSKAVAEFYAAQRHVPKQQVLGFDLTSSEDISRAEFRDSLQKPLAKALSSKKLWRIGPQKVSAGKDQPERVESRVVESKVRYAVLCYGIPLRIEADPGLKEQSTEGLRPELRRNEACVDSELALLPEIEQKLPLSGPLRNPAYGVTNETLLHPTNGVLMVTRLDGIGPEIARGLVAKAIQTENDGLWGRVYIDVRNTPDPDYKLGDDWIRNAGEICRRLGFETIVDENPGTFPVGFPMSHIALYLGWYTENVDGPFAEPEVEFMPGAFAYHLHSLSASTLRSKTQGWAGPLLAKGATATMGCVNEPYLTGTPDLAVFVARWLYSAFSFGEAAYASQPALSWQTTVVGDPLYRPFAKNPELLQQQLRERHSPLLPWGYLRVLDLNLANGAKVPDAVAFLEQLELTKQNAVLMEKLADLYSAQGKPSSAAHSYAEALKLQPSPQQRIRLELTLGEKLLALDRQPEAYATYQRLLEENPNYPDKVAILRKLLSLAQKLQKTQDAQKYEAAISGQNGAAK
ncbi:MAG TPA: TIGR03790 family protein [Candidatus Limnocylindrales bacterium]|nr:TIGR03790 family protein [Candidatus Limnocylindrales bacterium]